MLPILSRDTFVNPSAYKFSFITINIKRTGINTSNETSTVMDRIATFNYSLTIRRVKPCSFWWCCYWFCIILLTLCLSSSKSFTPHSTVILIHWEMLHLVEHASMSPDGEDTRSKRNAKRCGEDTVSTTNLLMWKITSYLSS